MKSTSFIEAAQAAELTVSAVRQAHRETCKEGGAMELLMREALADAVKLAQRLNEIAAFPDKP